MVPPHIDAVLSEWAGIAGEASPILRFTPAEFAAFLDGARNGEFDHLLD